ncbi:MAG TPA: ABC transporter substrate-binding protein [Anaerolineae bacterium]
MKKTTLVFAILAFALIISACGPVAATPPAGATSAPPASMTKATVVLQWVVQSQFAGYYAALEKGYYKEVGLDVTIKPGGPDIAPAQVVGSGGAEFGVGWLPGRILAPREQGTKLVNIAQVFQRSGTLELSWKDTSISKPADWKGKKVATWGLGNEPELYAAMRQVSIDPDKAADVTIVKQPFDMSLLLNREVDAAQAMIYNEYAQVLEATNPKTGALYKPEDLNVVDFNQVGTAMLQDGVMAREDWLADAKNQDTAVKFLQATFKGWVFCRDNFDECVNIVLKNGPTLGKSHMAWQLNEINNLIWPSPGGIGLMDAKLYAQTIDIAVKYGVLKNKPDDKAYRTDLAQKAVDALKAAGVDVTGASYKKRAVELKKGGE